MVPVLDGLAQSYASTLRHLAGTVRSLAVARDMVRDLVKCRDRDSDLVMHRGKDMDMFQLERDFNVPDVALAYIDGTRQMVCSLLRGLGGVQLIMDEPSLSWRSPALQSKMGVWPLASMALDGHSGPIICYHVDVLPTTASSGRFPTIQSRHVSTAIPATNEEMPCVTTSPEKPRHLQDISPRFSSLSIDLRMHARTDSQ
ncbi:hypothetical protein Syun_001134 [Stephania yunnanensis]|uniref:Uncharacterized protein n=1 Tax=Stephania yunnanensis TaxID=152371 RepID=A0AAP0LIT9_9MAGN